MTPKKGQGADIILPIVMADAFSNGRQLIDHRPYRLNGERFCQIAAKMRAVDIKKWELQP